jgi:hypothetical protein
MAQCILIGLHRERKYHSVHHIIGVCSWIDFLIAKTNASPMQLASLANNSSRSVFRESASSQVSARQWQGIGDGGPTGDAFKETLVRPMQESVSKHPVWETNDSCASHFDNSMSGRLFEHRAIGSISLLCIHPRCRTLSFTPISCFCPR